jgi:FkbM family methyltransferase
MSLIKKSVTFFKKIIIEKLRIIEAKKKGIQFSRPNYIYLEKFNANSTIVDVGCADDPDFSIFIMNKYDCKCFGIDPTKKHFEALNNVELNYKNKFKHLPYAVATENGKLIFHESENNTSGSLLVKHTNVKNDLVTSYEVDTINLVELKRLILDKGGKINFLKLDLEGAEYKLLENITPMDLNDIEQIFIEFHHHCIEGITIKDTLLFVKKIENFGFKSFSIDNHNFLFYK